jgi:hypothetical protein
LPEEPPSYFYTDRRWAQLMRGYNSTKAELSESEGRRVRRQLQPGGNEHAAAAKRARSNWAVNKVRKTPSWP